MDYTLVILLVFFGVFGLYFIADEIIEYFINKNLEKEFEIEKRNYYGK